MERERKICADGPYSDKNCCYAKVIEEDGEFPSVFYSVDENGKTSNVRMKVDKKAWCVYCTHPSCSTEKFIDTLEPYFSCYAPSDCPELTEDNNCISKKKKSTWKRLKKFFFT